MINTPEAEVFDKAYVEHTAPWVIGEPQPAILELEQSGWMRGRVLDIGCGTGEHTFYPARLGCSAIVLGMDASTEAFRIAQSKAAPNKGSASLRRCPCTPDGQWHVGHHSR